MGNVQNEAEHMDCKQNIIKRLNRIEGQVKGVRRMIEEEKDCVEVLTQIAAIRAAINKVGSMILENHSKTCIQKALMSDDSEKVLKNLTESIQKFLKFMD